MTTSRIYLPFHSTHRYRMCVRTQYVVACCSKLHLLNLLCGMTTFRNKCFEFFTPTQGRGCMQGQKMCLNGALCSIPFNLKSSWLLSKKKCFDHLTRPQGPRVCVRTECVLKWCSMLTSLVFEMQHDYFQKKNVLTIWPKNSKCIWSENTTNTNCKQTHGTARKSHTTTTRHQEDKLSKATSFLFSIKMIAKLEWTSSNVQHNINQLQTPTMGVR